MSRSISASGVSLWYLENEDVSYQNSISALALLHNVLLSIGYVLDVCQRDTNLIVPHSIQYSKDLAHFNE